MMATMNPANPRPARIESDELLVAAFMRFWPTVRAQLGERAPDAARVLGEIYDEGLWGGSDFSTSEILEHWPSVADQLRGRRWCEVGCPTEGGLYIELEHEMLTRRLVEPRAEVRRWFVGLDDELVESDLRRWNDLRENQYVTPVERAR